MWSFSAGQVGETSATPLPVREGHGEATLEAVEEVVWQAKACERPPPSNLPAHWTAAVTLRASLAPSA